MPVFRFTGKSPGGASRKRFIIANSKAEAQARAKNMGFVSISGLKQASKTEQPKALKRPEVRKTLSQVGKGTRVTTTPDLGPRERVLSGGRVIPRGGVSGGVSGTLGKELLDSLIEGLQTTAQDPLQAIDIMRRGQLGVGAEQFSRAGELDVARELIEGLPGGETRAGKVAAGAGEFVSDVATDTLANLLSSAAIERGRVEEGQQPGREEAISSLLSAFTGLRGERRRSFDVGREAALEQFRGEQRGEQDPQALLKEVEARRRAVPATGMVIAGEILGDLLGSAVFKGGGKLAGRFSKEAVEEALPTFLKAARGGRGLVGDVGRKLSDLAGDVSERVASPIRKIFSKAAPKGPDLSPGGREIVEEAFEETAERLTRGEPGEIAGLRLEGDAIQLGPSHAPMRISLKTFGDDASTLLRNMAKESPEKFQEARRGRVSVENMKAAAERLGVEVDDIFKREKGAPLKDSEVIAFSQVINDELSRLHTALRDGVRMGTLSDAEKAAHLAKMNEVSAAASELTGGVSEAARALRARQVAVDALKDPSQKAFEAMRKKLGGREMTEETLNRFAQLDPTDTVAMTKFLRSLHKSSFTDKLTEWWYNSILSGVPTHVVNNVSNFTMWATTPVEKVVSAAIDTPKSLATGNRARYFGEVPAWAAGSVHGITDGVSKALFMLKNGFDLDDATKFSTGRPEAFTGVPGALINIPSRALKAADLFWRSMNHSGELYSIAYRNAAKKGLKGKDLLKAAAKLIEEPTEEMLEEAGELASYRIFTSKPGKTTSALIGLRESNPAMRFLIPFINIPINLSKVGLERTPAGLVKVAQQIAKGQTEAATDTLSRVVIGSSVMAAMAAYAAQGKITGPAPESRGERDAFYRQGKQPFSIKIGDRWVQYRRIEPFNIPLTMVATAFQEFVEKDEDPDENTIKDIALTIGTNIADQTYLQSLSDLMDAIREPERHGDRFFQRFAGSIALPYSSFLRNVGLLEDPTMRLPTNISEAILSNVPVLKKDLIPRRNSFGEAVELSGGKLRGVIPYSISEEKLTLVDQKLDEAGLAGEIGFPAKTSRGVSFSPKTYDAYLELSGKEIKARLQNSIESGEWDTLTPDEKEDFVNRTIRESRSLYRELALAAEIWSKAKKMDEGERDEYFEKLVDDNALTENVLDWWDVFEERGIDPEL